MNQTLTVAAVQMVSCTNAQKNLDTALSLIKQAADKGAKLVILPEFFIRIADNTDNEFPNIVEHLGDGNIQRQLAKAARDNQVYLVGGTIPIKSIHSKRYYNTALVYNPQGEMICHYHKIHLFKFDDGKLKFDEGVTFTHGSEVKTFQIDNFSFGVTICYDLRFPELFRKMAGVDAMIISAAFTYHTGKDHWDVLLRARAIENQCYVIASGQGGIHENGRHTFGNSMIINPWGKIEAKLAKGEGIVMHTLKKEIINQIRVQLPALQHRKM